MNFSGFERYVCWSWFQIDKLIKWGHMSLAITVTHSKIAISKDDTSNTPIIRWTMNLNIEFQLIPRGYIRWCTEQETDHWNFFACIIWLQFYLRKHWYPLARSTGTFGCTPPMINLVTFPTLHIAITLSLLITSRQNENGIGCTSCGNVAYRKGFRCRTDTDIFTNLTDIPHHICTHRCMTLRSCILVNYNVEQRYCSLSNELCVEYIADAWFVVAYFGSKEALCLKWVSYTLYDNANAITAPDCHPEPPLSLCALGRLVSSPDYSVIGKYIVSVQGIWAVLDGAETTVGEKEILNI